MPLKEVDLKTFEAYKKAIRADLPKVSAGNARFWIYRDIELPNAAGKKQKIGSFIVLVDDHAIKPMLHGKKLVCMGRCGLEDDKIAFAAETGKVPYRQLKSSVPLFLGKLLYIPANVDPDSDEDGEDLERQSPVEKVEPTATASQESSPSPSGLAAVWNQLASELRAEVAAHPDRKEALTLASAGIPELIKANKNGEAQQRMDALRALLNPPQQTGTGLSAMWNTLVAELKVEAAAHPERRESLSQAAAGIPDLIKTSKAEEARHRMEALRKLLDSGSKPAGSRAVTTAELTARWNALLKQMQAAVTAQPAKRPEIVRAGAGIPDMIRAGKLDLATKLMDGVDAILKALPQAAEVPFSRPEETAHEPAQQSAEAPEESAQERSEAAANRLEFERRLPNLDKQAEEVLQSKPRNAAKIRLVLDFAREKGEQRQYDAALLALRNLEALLDAADDDEETGSGVPYESLVKYRTALLGFAKAKSKVTGQIAALKGAIPAILPHEAEVAEDLAAELTNWNDELGELINNAMNTAEDDQSPVTDAIRNSLAEYIAELSSNELIQHVDQNKFGVPVSIAATLGTALKNIQQAMPGRTRG